MPSLPEPGRHRVGDRPAAGRHRADVRRRGCLAVDARTAPPRPHAARGRRPRSGPAPVRARLPEPVLRHVAVQRARYDGVSVAAVGRALVRHDAERLRHVRADDARDAEVVDHRFAGRADCDVAGRGGRLVRRLFRRQAQHAAAGAGRSAAGAAGVPHHRDPLAGVPRTDVAALRGPALGLSLDGDGAHRARDDAIAEGARVRAGRPLHGRAGMAHHLPPHPAEHVVAAHHRRHDQRERADPRGSGPVVLRLRRAAAGRVARDAHRQLRERGPHLPVAVLLSRPPRSSCWCCRSTWSATRCATRSIRNAAARGPR